jgi:hypothetical protein
MNHKMTHPEASKPSSLCAHVRRAGTWVLQGYCRQDRLALDGHSVECHPQGSLKSWRVTAKGYRWDGSTQFLDSTVEMDGEGLMVARTPGLGDSASFDPSAFFKMMAEERPPTLGCLLARLPAMEWNDLTGNWEPIGPVDAGFSEVL